jgi:hypothetical protein
MVLPLYGVGADTRVRLRRDSYSAALAPVGEVHSSEHSAEFANSALQPNGAVFTRNGSPTVDGRIGGQQFARITPELSALIPV